jgi:Fe-S-cluster containining protein
VLDAQIATRVDETRRRHAYWPCKEGCDLCCRSLPKLPVITEPEWLRLLAALAALDPSTAAEIRQKTRDAPTGGPLTCPLLDPKRGACLVYEARPIACRTYGYYAERDARMCCERVTEALEGNGEAEAVVWGNGEAVARALDEHGDALSLREWMLTARAR